MSNGKTMSAAGIALAFLLATGGCGGHGAGSGSGGEGTPAARATARVTMVQARSGVVAETLETYGSVEFDPHETRTVSFVISGQVMQVFVSPGQPITRNDSLLILGSMPSTSREVEQARIDLQYAEQKQERTRRLLKKQLATNEAMMQADKDVAMARAVLEGLGVGGKGESGRIISSPFSGVVVDVLVKSGDIVHAGQGALLVAPTEGLVVRAGFEPEDAVNLAEGMSVTLSPVFSPDGRAGTTATLARLHRVVDPVTQVVETLLAPGEVPPWMMAGTRVKVAVDIKSSAASVMVPREAVLSRDGSFGVFAVEAGVAHWRPVHIGLENDSWVEVRSGLDPGATVVTTGRTSLDDGMPVVAAGAKGG